MVKTSVIRLAFAKAKELRTHDIACVALTPGFLRSEAVLDHFGVTEETWRDAAKKDPDFLSSETPFFVGRAVAGLAADPNVLKKTGTVLSSWDLALEYDFDDVDGRRPNWGRHFEEKYGRIKQCDQPFYDYWEPGPLELVFPDAWCSHMLWADSGASSQMKGRKPEGSEQP